MDISANCGTMMAEEYKNVYITNHRKDNQREFGNV